MKFVTRAINKLRIRDINDLIQFFLLPRDASREIIYPYSVMILKASCTTYLNISVSKMMSVPLQCHVSVLLRDKSHVRQAVPSVLWVKTQNNSTSEIVYGLKAVLHLD